jgi:predicted ester cyclase
MKTHISTDAPLEANKAVVRRYFETFNAGDFERLDEIVAQDYGDRLEGQAAGIAVIRNYLEGLKASFPDFTWTIEQLIAEGDRVAVMNRVTGTHLHDFGEMKATGNRVDFKAFQIYRIADESWPNIGKSPTSPSSRSSSAQNRRTPCSNSFSRS